MIARSAPEAAVFPIKVDGVDGAGGTGFVAGFVAHFLECFARPGWRTFIQENISWFGIVVVKRAAHLEAVDVGCFTSLLDIHAKFHYVEEKLQQVLILRITSLHRKGEKGFAFFERQGGG